jgi:hypothetical protein
MILPCTLETSDRSKPQLPLPKRVSSEPYLLHTDDSGNVVEAAAALPHTSGNRLGNANFGFRDSIQIGYFSGMPQIDRLLFHLSFKAEKH